MIRKVRYILINVIIKLDFVISRKCQWIITIRLYGSFMYSIESVILCFYFWYKKISDFLGKLLFGHVKAMHVVSSFILTSMIMITK